MHITIDRVEAHARLLAAGCSFVGEIVLGTETWRLPSGEVIVLNYEHIGDFPEGMIREAEKLARNT